MPRWLLAWLVLAGLLFGGATGVLAYEVIDLHAQAVALRQTDLGADAKTCRLAAGNRVIIAEIAARVRPPVPVPPIPAEECP